MLQISLFRFPSFLSIIRDALWRLNINPTWGGTFRRARGFSSHLQTCKTSRRMLLFHPSLSACIISACGGLGDNSVLVLEVWCTSPQPPPPQTKSKGRHRWIQEKMTSLSHAEKYGKGQIATSVPLAHSWEEHFEEKVHTYRRDYVEDSKECVSREPSLVP